MAILNTASTVGGINIYDKLSSISGGGNPGFITIGPTNSGADYECNGTNDTSQFQAAINLHKPIYIYPGSYNITSIINCTGLNIKGVTNANNGQNVTINCKTDDPVFYIDQGPAFVENIDFSISTPSSTNTTVISIDSNSGPAHQCYINNCSFSQTGNITMDDAIYVSSSDQYNMDITISNCYFIGNMTPINLAGCPSSKIFNNKFEQCDKLTIQLSTNTQSIQIYTNIYNNIFGTWGDGSNFITNSAISIQNMTSYNGQVIISGNQFFNFSLDGVISLTGDYANNLVITNNIANTCTTQFVNVNSTGNINLVINSNILNNNILNTTSNNTKGVIVGNTSTSTTPSITGTTNMKQIGNSWQTETLY